MRFLSSRAQNRSMQRRDRTDDLEVPRCEIFTCGVLSWLSDGSFESCFLCCVTFHLFLPFLLFTSKIFLYHYFFSRMILAMQKKGLQKEMNFTCAWRIWGITV